MGGVPHPRRRSHSVSSRHEPSERRRSAVLVTHRHVTDRMTVVRRYGWIPLALLAACGKSDGRTVLTVYSPHGKELLEYYEAGFEKEHPTVDVQWVDMGSQEVLDRLRAEKANPQADLWFGAPAEIFARGAGEGLLEPYTPTWGDKVPPEARNAKGAWFGTYMT